MHQRKVRIDGLRGREQLKTVAVSDGLDKRLRKKFEDGAQNFGVGSEREDAVVRCENAPYLKSEVLFRYFLYKLSPEVERALGICHLGDAPQGGMLSRFVYISGDANLD